MSSLLVFNHHSLPFESAEAANDAVPEFLRICIRSQTLGLFTILVDEHVDSAWFNVQLATGYCWRDWYNQNKNNENVDIIRAFRQIKTRQPLFSIEDIGNDVELFEVALDGDTSYSALRAAAWHESPMTSFPTRNPWDEPSIEVLINTIQSDANLRSESYSIDNLYSLDSLGNIEAELLRKRDLAIRGGREIFSNRESLYPYLQFCGKTEEQLLHWSYSETILNQLKESLSVLNSFTEKWKNNEIISYSDDGLRESGMPHRMSGESASVLQNPDRRQERVIWLPDGRSVVFEKHIKIAHGFRIYFYPETETRTMYVGYIGPHLRT
ncbi:MAG: hypothetical protein JW780_04745 [Clostridiales bacterium]|nr:hypothetical protein [Clostridiales bacterium]